MFSSYIKSGTRSPGFKSFSDTAGKCNNSQFCDLWPEGTWGVASAARVLRLRGKEEGTAASSRLPCRAGPYCDVVGQLFMASWAGFRVWPKSAIHCPGEEHYKGHSSLGGGEGCTFHIMYQKPSWPENQYRSQSSFYAPGWLCSESTESIPAP